MGIFESDGFFWLFYAFVIRYSLVLPLYNHRKKIRDQLASTKFSIGYLLFLTLIIALCFHVGHAWKRYSEASQENRKLNHAVAYERFNGISLDQRAELNQERISELEQWCREYNASHERESASQARNELALSRLDDSWARLEPEIQIQKRPGVISLLPLPIKDTDTSSQYEHKRYQIQTSPDDRLELVFKVLKRKKLLEGYQWDEAKNPNGPFTVVNVNNEYKNMRFPLPPGNSTLELKNYDKRSTKPAGFDNPELLELIINDESVALVAGIQRYSWFDNHSAIAVQVDYPREKLNTRLKDVNVRAESDRAVRLEIHLSNSVARTNVEEDTTNGAARADSVEPINE